MTERIYKLQPDRTLHLRGFDSLGASAALHSATPGGFTVSGTFRDPADFAVLVLHDADNFFEHPRLKYLPETDFSGLTLGFDVTYENLMPLDSGKYPTIDWPFLDVIRPDGTTARIRLSDQATPLGAPGTPATAGFTIDGASLDAYDRVTLWYFNLAFDYIVPGKLRIEFAFFAAGPGTEHSITIAGRTYSYVEQEGDSSAAIAAALAARVNGAAGGYSEDPDATAGGGSEAHMVSLERRLDTGAQFSVAASGNGPDTLWHVKPTTVAAALAAQIESAGYAAAGTPFALRATSNGLNVQIETVETGYDANHLTMYATSKNERLRTTAQVAQFSGGSSAAAQRVSLNFAALGVPHIRTMWLTFAPRLANGAAYQDTEWRAVFSNWSVAGPEESRRLQVASPRSVRVGASSPRVRYSGLWVQEEGFFNGNFARGAATAGARVEVRYHCAHPHDLWLGTSLYSDRGRVAVEIDGAGHPALDCALAAEPPVVTRRKLAAGLAPGDHLLRLTLLDDKPFYFDFLEAVVPGDVPAALPAVPDLSAALDYSTDHTWKLPPVRILWNLERLGLAGPLNQYLGVFWWNQRRRTGAVLPSAEVTFSGNFVPGDAVFVRIGDQICGKTVFDGDTAESIAAHFRYFVNGVFVGVWAASSGAALTLHARSPLAAYSYQVQAWVEPAAGSTGQAQLVGTLTGGVPGVWEVDPAQAPALNRGARDWHADFYAQCAQRGFTPTTAMSMELVNPPEVFAARFPEGAPVLTSVGFGGLHSTHCSFISPVLDYQKAVFGHLAALMQAAGLTPDLQCGEFCWWYFSSYSATNPSGGMAYYDGETAAAALSALGRPLHRFLGPHDDPAVNATADAGFLRHRLRDYAAALVGHVRSLYPLARTEVLYPHDVNHPTPSGVHALGGRLNLFVNLPLEWHSPASAPFDRFRIEGLDFGAWSRNLDLTLAALRFPLDLGWPPAKVRAMIPVFRGGYPWEKELSRARELRLDACTLWAFDHVCLYGWPARQAAGRASYQG